MARFLALAGMVGLVLAAPGPHGSGSALASGAQAEEAVERWLEQHRERPGSLRAFLQRMPKGGDLHSHLSGAVYAEHYLKWAAADGLCIDPVKPSLLPASDCGQGSPYLPAAMLMEKPNLYSRLVNLWSTRNLPFAGRSGHDQFFDAFAGFGLISGSLARQDDMVAEVANRAAAQQISYLELMLTIRGGEVGKLGSQLTWNGDFDRMQQRLLGLGLMELVAKGRQDLAILKRETEKTLGCGTAQAQAGCAVTIRFLQQTVRTRSPADVFAQLVYAFELAKASPEVVGINLVAPEDHPIALRDYGLHMRLLQHLKQRSPEVKIALHAGELDLGLVPPDELRFHIRQAVEIAQASRIGHGVAVMHEDEPFQLLEMMRRRGVLVEICLTSNEVILNVKGQRHPFQEYRRAGVPITLASDDEGISRIDLSNEYQLAVERYGLGYRDLKTLARNSLEYSFLPGSSLWDSADYRFKQAACDEDLPGAVRLTSRCVALLQASERARAQWDLETRLAQFEALPSFRIEGKGPPRRALRPAALEAGQR
jgi:hypothetical protein